MPGGTRPGVDGIAGRWEENRAGKGEMRVSGPARNPSKAPVSAFLITRNEEQRLPATLAALQWADEIVVVDSGSVDRTEEIARDAGARFHHHDWTGYGAQKRHAEGLCSHDWVLNVDADEVVTDELAREIADLLATRPSPAGYRVRILNVYPGDSGPRPFANDYDVVRFYHRAAGSYRDHPLFDRVVLSGPERRLRGAIHHNPLLSLHHMVEKENAYSSYVAETAGQRSRTGLLLRLPFEMPVAFLKFYFLRRHVFGGWKGFMFSLTAAFARTLRIAKMLERQDNDT